MMAAMRGGFLFAAALGLAIQTQHATAGQTVALELVLAIDTSTSVDDSEYRLQRDGLSRAFEHPSVVRAIESQGAEGIAVSVVQWAGTRQQFEAVPWAFMNNRSSAAEFAARIAAMPRSLKGFTDIADVIDYSVLYFERNAFDGRRRVIDVSGDGTSDREDPAISRDAAILRGVTINGLIIHSIEYDLGDLARFDLQNHYRDKVIGGEGAFLLNAESFRTFGQSIREKLVREIAGPLFAAR